VAIVQSNYIPWKGYFDLINLVDEFILFDDMQYTRRDWRNRNLIKTRAGLKWLTIPVAVKGNFFQKIKDTRVSDPGWGRTHWESIVHNYSKANHFAAFREVFESLYLGSQESFLSQINYAFLTTICKILRIETRITWSDTYESVEGKTERLVSICKQAGATTYISGPAARDYIDEGLFNYADISLEYMDYSAYPEYRQLFPPFEHGVSVIDLIFNEGPDAPKFMKSFSR
jgi:hypothetical protein